MFNEGYPHAFYGRHVEGVVRTGDLTYEEFKNKYLPLDGIMGKVLNEAHYYVNRPNLKFFKRFKQEFPEKLVLMHYNGTGRRATDEITKFFPGHFLYYTGTRLTRAIGSRTAKVLQVRNTSVFSTDRSGTGSRDDISIARTGRDGRPDWSTAEHVRLERIDARNKTITVRRGMYRSRASTFPAGSYLAAHVMTGPYRFNSAPENNIPLWNYNFSTKCPTDAQGRNGGTALADFLGEKLGPGGEIEALDGIVFDVFSWVIRFGSPIRAIDVDTNGRADAGVIGGLNTVSQGVLSFFEQLRDRLPDKLIISDGHIPSKSQRAFGFLNGMESEGYPDKYDYGLDHVSRGENIFGYWRDSGWEPQFYYANFRYKEDRPRRLRNTMYDPILSRDKSYRRLRSALASTHFTGAAFTASGGDLEGDGGGNGWLPPEVVWRETGARVRIFDELCKGTEQETHWLGQPLDGVVHMAERAPDIFGEDGETWPDTFVERFGGQGVGISRGGTPTEPRLEVRAAGSGRGLDFALPGVDVRGRDLFFTLRLRAEPLEDFPASVPRRVDVYAVPPRGGLNSANREFTWAGPDSFDATLYFQDVGPGRVTIRFEVEGRRQVYLERITAHSAADGRYREYEGGIVFANPSMRAFTFDVAALFPGATLQRIQGSANQDPYDRVNNGRPVGEELTIPARDALFVVRV